MATSAQTCPPTRSCQAGANDAHNVKSSSLDAAVNARWMLELVISAGIIMLVGAAQIVIDTDAIYKATVMEPVGLMRPLQVEAIERYALTGSWDDPDAGPQTGLAEGMPGAGRERARRIASVRDLEETQAGLSRLELAAAGVEGLGTRRQSSSNAVVGLSNGIPMAVVASAFVPTPSIIEFRPAVNTDAPGLVNWLCGHQREVAGATAPPPREPTVPDHLLPMPCRVKL